MEEILPLLFALAVIGGIVLYKASLQKDGARRWSAVAHALGLRVVDGGLLGGLELSGTIGGVAVKAWTETRSGNNNTRTVTLIQAVPALPVPDGLEIGAEGVLDGIAKMLGGQDLPLEDRRFDDVLRVRGRPARAVQGLLDHPEARPALELLVEDGTGLAFRKGAFRQELPAYGGHGLAEALEAAVQAAQALDRAATAPWADAARHLGLRYEEDAGVASLAGTLSGLEVRVLTSGSPPATRFCVRLQGGLPRGVRLRAGTGGVLLRDPILDGRLVLEPVDRTDPGVLPAARAWLKGRLQDPAHDLRGGLMDVLHGLEGTAVENGEVTLVSAGRAGPELVDSLRRLAALAVALGEGPPAAPEPTPTAETGHQAAQEASRRAKA